VRLTMGFANHSTTRLTSPESMVMREEAQEEAEEEDEERWSGDGSWGEAEARADLGRLERRRGGERGPGHCPRR